jgi:GNAT superfamily N-acetyltransferase
MPPITVHVAQRNDSVDLAAFAASRPIVWTDFESIALLQPDEPRVLIARDPASGGAIVAAAIDDGLAMSVGGSPEGLDAIAAEVLDIADRLVIAGRTPDVRRFVRNEPAGRSERPEHYMAVARGALLRPIEQLPIRVATEDDLPLLIRVRAAALAEEYGIPVSPESKLHHELAQAVTRAVSLQGVAIWIEDGGCAFTAQLIAKTPSAAMFGDLYVEPSLRGAGRATRALTTFCAWLMSESDHVTLRVGRDNDAAVRLYERVGFTVIDDFCTSLSSTAPVAEAAEAEGAQPS